MVKGYLLPATKAPNEIKHHGIKGMKWGVRKNTSTDATPKTGGGLVGKLATTVAKKTQQPTDASISHLIHPQAGETSQSRYTRVNTVAKAGKTSLLSDDDMRFYLARTDAIARINKLHEKNPDWLKTASSEIIKNIAKQQINSVANNAANQFISTPINQRVTSKAKQATAPRRIGF